MANLRTLVQSAFDTARKGYYRDALEEFETVLSHDPRHLDALFGAAGCAYRLERYSEAGALIERFLLIDPKNTRALELRAKIQGNEITEVSSSFSETPEVETVPVEERFGVLSNEKISDPLTGWVTLDVRVPGVMDKVRDGRPDFQGTLHPLQAFFDARKLFRSNRKSLFQINLIAVTVFVCVLGFVGGMVFQLAQFSLVIALVCGLVLTPLVYPILGIFSFYAFHLRKAGEIEARDFRRYWEAYPYLMFAMNGFLIPSFVGFLVFLVYYAFFVQGHELTPVRLYILNAFPYLILLFQGYFLFRCWFLNLVAYAETKEPMTLLARSFYLTRGNHFRLLGFLAVQALAMILAIVSLGYLFPLVPLMQAEGYFQLSTPEDPTEWKRRRS